MHKFYLKLFAKNSYTMPSVYSVRSEDDIAGYSSDDDGGTPPTNPFFLGADRVICSQSIRVYFSPEANEKEPKLVEDEEEDSSLEIVHETNNVLSNWPHAKVHCAVSKDPLQPCKNCFCLMCDGKAEKCKNWAAHCTVTYESEEYKKMRSALREKEKQALTIPNSAAEAIVPLDAGKLEIVEVKDAVNKNQTADAKHVELLEKVTKLEKEMAELDIEKNSAITKLELIQNLMMMDQSELKRMCQDKHLKIQGQGNVMKNKYFFKLVTDLFLKRDG